MVTFSRATVIPNDGTFPSRRPSHCYDYFAVGLPADHPRRKSSITSPLFPGGTY